MGAVSSKGKTKGTEARRARKCRAFWGLDLVRVNQVKENMPRAVFTERGVDEGRKGRAVTRTEVATADSAELSASARGGQATALRGLRHDIPPRVCFPVTGDRLPGTSRQVAQAGKEARAQSVNFQALGSPHASGSGLLPHLSPRYLPSCQRVLHTVGPGRPPGETCEMPAGVSVRRDTSPAHTYTPGSHKPRGHKRRPQPLPSQKFRAGEQTRRMRGKTAAALQSLLVG